MTALAYKETRGTSTRPYKESHVRLVLAEPYSRLPRKPELPPELELHFSSLFSSVTEWQAGELEYNEATVTKNEWSGAAKAVTGIAVALIGAIYLTVVSRIGAVEAALDKNTTRLEAALDRASDKLQTSIDRNSVAVTELGKQQAVTASTLDGLKGQLEKISVQLDKK